MGSSENTMEAKAHSRKRRQEYRWAKAHLRTMFSTYWYITNKPFTVPNCTGSRAFKSIPFVALEDPPKNPMHQSFIGEKGKVPTQVVYVERIPGNVTGTFITDLSDALNEVSGIFGSLCPMRTSRRSSRDWPAEFIEWIRKQCLIRYVPTSNHSKRDCHMSYHPQSESLPTGEAQVGQEPDYK